jgi:hypothetical protein
MNTPSGTAGFMDYDDEPKQRKGKGKLKPKKSRAQYQSCWCYNCKEKEKPEPQCACDNPAPTYDGRICGRCPDKDVCDVPKNPENYD